MNYRIGEILGLVLGGFLLLWLGADAIVWLTGGATFSAWLIREQRRKLSVTIATLVILTALYIVLILHFETIVILRDHLGF